MYGRNESILVIEDKPESLELLEQLLETAGYSVRLIPEAGMAIQSALTNPPDLILLDIMMPEIDGIEVCHQLKNHKQTRDIPVIFISAFSDISNKMKAFSAGGVDYISKPFHREEVLARVSTHLRLRNLQKHIEEINNSLENRIRERTAELVRVYEEKNEINRQLLQSQKMEAIGTLAGGIAHDFNNILFTMFGYLELIISKLPENSQVAEWTKEVLKSAVRARDLVDQILTFSRQSEIKQKPLRIYLVVNEILKLIRATLPSTIQIRSNINKNCGSVMADPTQIHQIVMNLVTNAFHAMEEKGGVLEISLKDVILQGNDLNDLCAGPGEYVCLSVKDTGIGMEKKVMDRIFEPYFTTKEKGKGTGLGLSVVHGIVKNYGGIIKVHSEPGIGSEFEIFLPKINENPIDKKFEHSGPIMKGSEHILLVDDEQEIIGMLEKILIDLGYQVTPRTSSIEALKAFEANPNRFDLVITDFTMPNMTGVQLATHLMEIRKDIPIILCTGHSERINADAAKAMGIREFVKKPVLRYDLAKTIRQVLDQQSQSNYSLMK